MHNLIELEKDNNIKVMSVVVKYTKPDKIYIPIPLNSNILVIKNEVVCIDFPLIKTQDMIITSPISGKILDIEEKENLNGKTKVLVIENNYHETKMNNKEKIDLKNLNASNLNNILLNNFNIKIDNDILILNCLDDEPYILTESYYMFNYYEEFLELLDNFSKIYNLKKIIICLKSTNSEHINKLMEWLGMYPNISLEVIPNLYLISNNYYLKQYLEITEAIIIKASLFYDTYNLLKRNRFKTDKLFTISGNALENPMIVKVKIGTKLSDVITNLIKLKNKEIEYYANGLMQGKVITTNDFIITPDLNGILIMEKEDIKEDTCLKCGACAKVCPVKLKPYLFSNAKYLNEVKNTCLKCGLCTYICPSYINFNKYIGGNNE